MIIPDWFNSVLILAGLSGIIWQVAKWESKIKDDVDKTKDGLIDRMNKVERTMAIFMAEKRSNEKIIIHRSDELKRKLMSIEKFLAKNSKFATRDTKQGDSGMFQ